MIPIYEQNLIEKQQQIETMREEIDSYEENMSEYTIELNRLQKELDGYKNKYYLQKKRDQQNRDERKTQ